jgi:hypothetical protein
LQRAGHERGADEEDGCREVFNVRPCQVVHDGRGGDDDRRAHESQLPASSECARGYIGSEGQHEPDEHAGRCEQGVPMHGKHGPGPEDISVGHEVLVVTPSVGGGFRCESTRLHPTPGFQEVVRQRIPGERRSDQTTERSHDRDREHRPQEDLEGAR